MSLNQRRLLKTFLHFVQIASPSNHEAIFRSILEKILQSLGAKTKVDRTGNLIARLPGQGKTPFLLAAHLDTVEPGRHIKPVVRGNTIYSDGTTILGADDKAGIALIVEVLRTCQERKLVHPPLELVFTVGEEQYTRGAKALDKSKLRSPYGLVIDGTAVNAIDYGAPFIATADIVINGKSAHSGAEPEKGIHAIQIAARAIAQMKLGRIDQHTTANVGTIHGGTNRNSVPDRVVLTNEVRSFSQVKLEQQLERMHKAIEDAAEYYGGTADIAAHIDVPGFMLKRTNPLVKQVHQAMLKANLKPEYRLFCGVSDANVFNNAGITVLDLGTGVQHPHTVRECIAITDMMIAGKIMFQVLQSPLT